MQDGLYIKVNFLFLCHISQQMDILLIRVSVDTLYRDGANDVSRERIQTAPQAHPGRAS